jgi:C4-type Zn-finger protein
VGRCGEADIPTHVHLPPSESVCKPCGHKESTVSFVPIMTPKKVIVFVRGVDKTKKVRKAVSLAIKMEIIKRAEGGQQSKDMYGHEFVVYKS